MSGAIKSTFSIMVLLFAAFQCCAQTLAIIKREGKTLEDFVPRNWKIIQTATGDLNKDQADDAAIVIQEMDPKKITIDSRMAIDTLNENPRILIIIFKDTISNTFKLKEITKTFILNHYSRNMDDPFDGIMISKGILGIGFHFWYNAGSWFQTVLEYKFRFQQNEFYLIGAEFHEIDRSTTNGIKRSFNFSTKKMSETTITFENDATGEQIENSKTEWKTLEIKELKTLKSLTTPLQWTVAPGVQI